MKKKICLIAQFPPPIHGLSKAVDTIVNSQLTNSFDFEKINLTNNKKFISNLIKIYKSNAEIFYFTISQTKWGNVRDLVILKILNFRKRKSIIHLHGGYFRHLVDYEMSKLQSRLNYKAISKVDYAIVLSPILKSNFTNMLEEEKILVVPNCIDNEYLLSDEEFDEKLSNLPLNNLLNVLYLSNFIQSKGYKEVLELARIEKERVENGAERRYLFHFAGKFFDEKEEKSFLEYIKENQLEQYVIFYGVVDGKEKKDLLKQADIFILLSRYPNEGQPISILEAMGNGCIIVTTDHAGIVDVVKDGVNGIVVNKEQQKNSEELYNRMLCTKEISTCNRKIVMQNYTETIYINNLKSIFNH
jgi:glycosyltransferase involved in cell wall biosynthesis